MICLSLENSLRTLLLINQNTLDLWKHVARTLKSTPRKLPKTRYEHSQKHDKILENFRFGATKFESKFHTYKREFGAHKLHAYKKDSISKETGRRRVETIRTRSNTPLWILPKYAAGTSKNVVVPSSLVAGTRKTSCGYP